MSARPCSSGSWNPGSSRVMTLAATASPDWSRSVCLRELAANRPAANDCQPARLLGEREDRFVGQRTGVGQAGNRRNDWARSGRDDRATETQPAVANENRVRIGEACLSKKDIHARLLNRSAESCGDMLRRMRRTRSITTGKSRRLSFMVPLLARHRRSKTRCAGSRPAARFW